MKSRRVPLPRKGKKRGTMSAHGAPWTGRHVREKKETAMTEDERIAQLFSFLLERGFTFERDYNKGTDKTCTQIYRFRLNAANYLEYRVLSEYERTLMVCVRGEKKFPAVGKKYASFIRRWKLSRLFQKKDLWELAADVCRHDLEETGKVFGLEI